MKRLLAVVALALTVAGPAGAQANLVRNAGFEEGDGAGPAGWRGASNAGAPVFERTREQARAGEWSGKIVCRPGDEYARWVHARPDLFAGTRCRDRMRLTFHYRAEASLGDALVQVSTDAPPGWRQYTLGPLRATGGAWAAYAAEFTVDVSPSGGGEVQLRATTNKSGAQIVTFDDVSLQVIGADPLPGPLPFPKPKGRTMLTPQQIRAIEADLESPPLRTAAEGLRRFLEERIPGARVELRRPSSAPAPGTVLLGTAGGSPAGIGAAGTAPSEAAGVHPALLRWNNQRRWGIAASGERDAYVVAERDGCIALLGANPRAALYAAHRLEDLLALEGGMPKGFLEKADPALELRLLHPRVRGGFHSYRQADFEFVARCGGNVAHLSHDWIGEKTLFSFVPCPEFPNAVDAPVLERNRAALRRYLDWCRPYGLRAALWLCEIVCQGGPWMPEAHRQSFLKQFPPECLSDSGTYQGKVLCLAHPLVEQAYRGMVRRLVADFPELEMLLVFSIDSNGELCDPQKCERHRGVSKLHQYHRLIALLAEEGRRARPGFQVYAIGWGWHFRGAPGFLDGQAALPAGAGLTSPPDGEAWSFDRKMTDALVSYRDVTRRWGQPFLGYDIFLWGDDTVFPETELFDFPLGVAAKVRRWQHLGADGVFDQWGTQAEYVQNNAIALRRFFFHPEETAPGRSEEVARRLAGAQYGERAGEHVFAAWQEIEAAQRIQSEHTYYWHHLRPGWAGVSRSCPLTLDALQKAELHGGEPSKVHHGVDQCPYRDDISRARSLGLALGKASDHFARAAALLRRGLDALPEGHRSLYEHWYPTPPGALPRLTPREQLEKELVAVRLQEKVQRRLSRFFAAYALVHTLPLEGAPGRQEALADLAALQAADEAAAHEP